MPMIHSRRSLLGIFGATLASGAAVGVFSSLPRQAASSTGNAIKPSASLSQAARLKPQGEISATDFLAEASDAEIDEVEKETGYSFSGPTVFNGGIDRDFSSNLLPDEPIEESETIEPKLKSHKASKKKTAGHRWYDTMSPDEAYLFAQKTIGVPADTLKKIVWNESKGDQNAVNDHTGACGLGQLMPKQALPEMAYKHSDMLGLDLHSKVEKFIIGKDRKNRSIVGYRPHKGQNPYLLDQCYNSWVNVSLFSMNLIEKMRRVDKMLAADGKQITNFTEADLYVAHFLGARPDIMLALRENPNKAAKDFVNKRTQKQNHHMFFDENKRARTVAQMYAHIEEKGGPSTKILISPFWRNSESKIAQRVEMQLNAG